MAPKPILLKESTMSDHVKFYDYYIVEGPEVQALIESFEPISQKRSELIKEAMTLVEAVGWVDSQSFGDKGDKIQSFVWKADHKFPCEITIKDEAIWIRYR
jgi:hypothetical protein